MFVLSYFICLTIIVVKKNTIAKKVFVIILLIALAFDPNLFFFLSVQASFQKVEVIEILEPENTSKTINKESLTLKNNNLESPIHAWSVTSKEKDILFQKVAITEMKQFPVLWETGTNIISHKTDPKLWKRIIVARKKEKNTEVSFSQDDKIIDENGKELAVSDFQPPVKLEESTVNAMSKLLSWVNVQSIYKIWSAWSLVVMNNGKRSLAKVTLPIWENTFANQVLIYSSQDGYERKYHSKEQRTIWQNWESYVEFLTDHFTYYLVWQQLWTFVINNDDAQTTGLNVVLNTQITWATQMKVWNSYQEIVATWWISYSANKVWQLTWTNGIKTVHAMFKDVAGLTWYVSDSILLLQNSYSSPTLVWWLSAWYDANQATSIMSNWANKITQWSDVSWNWNHLTVASNQQRPTYQVSWINGKWTVQFGWWEWLSTSTTFSKPYTVFSVSAPDPSYTVGCLVCSANSFWILWYWYAWEDLMYAPNNRVWNPWSNLTSAPRIYWASSQWSQTTFYKNGYQLAVNNSNLWPINRLQLWTVQTNSSYSKKWDISEVLIYNRELSASEIETIECYLSQKRNIQVEQTCISNQGPILSNITSVVTPTNNTTISLAFDSTKSWIISLSWSCSGFLLTANAQTWSNQIQIWALSNWSYPDCSISVTDSFWQISNILSINPFVINTNLSGTSISPLVFPWLKLWLDWSDAASMSLDWSNRIWQRNDKSGYWNDVYAANTSQKPSLINWWLNNLTTVAFQWNDYLSTNSTSLIWSNLDYTKFMVIKIDNSNITNCVLWNYGWHTLYFWWNTPVIYNQGYTLNSPVSLWSNYAVVIASYNPSLRSAIYINWTTVTQNNTNAIFHDNWVTYVWSWGWTCPLQWKIAEIWMYNQWLLDSQRQQLECYLGNKRWVSVSTNCWTNIPPVLSNWSTISSPQTTSPVAFSFTSSKAGTIKLHWDCEGLLQTPSNGLAVSGTNNIQIWPVMNGNYSCSVSVTDWLAVVSNILPIPAFTVTGIIGSLPVIRSWAANSATMTQSSAGFSFYTDTSGLITLGGSCAMSALIAPIATTGFNTMNFAFLQTWQYVNCTIQITNSFNKSSKKYLLAPFTIIQWQSTQIWAPWSLVRTWTALPIPQNIDYSITNKFFVKDNNGLDQWRYTTLQATSLSGSYTNIASSNIFLTAAWVNTIAWQNNPRVQVASLLNTYQLLNTPQVFLKRNTWPNSSTIWTYWASSTIRVSLPAYPIVDSYQGRLVYTIYDL